MLCSDPPSPHCRMDPHIVVVMMYVDIRGVPEEDCSSGLWSRAKKAAMLHCDSGKWLWCRPFRQRCTQTGP